MKRGDQQSDFPPDRQKPDGIFGSRPETQDDAAEEAESKLLEASLQGDIKAFADLFERYRPGLYALSYRRLGDSSLAEDVVQEVFIKAFKKLPDSDYRKPMWPWLATIAHRMCIDVQRRRSFTHYSGDISVSVDAGADNGTSEGETGSALDDVIASEERAELWGSLKILPKRQRRVFVLYAVDGWSCADIAAAEGISVGAVKLLLFRARRKMRIARQGQPPALVVLPVTWLRLKLQEAEDRIRLLLSTLGERLGPSGALVVSMGIVAAIAAVAGNPTGPSTIDRLSSDESIVSKPPAQMFQTARSAPNLANTPKAPADSGQSVAESAELLIEDVINPNQNATPETSVLQSMTASPSYEDDHTILVVGIHKGTSVLFVSNDGGGNWKPRPSRLLSGSEMVLPPDFPHDRRIFVFGYPGLQQSDDGGEIFRMVSLMLGRGVAISPSFGRRDSKILMGGRIIFEFDASTGLTQPALLNIPPGLGAGTYPFVAFSPGYPSDSIVFVSDEGGVSYRCKGSVCDVIQLPRSAGPLRFRFSPRCDQVGLTYAFRPWRLLVSHDRARTFEEVPFPLQYQDTFSDARSFSDVAVLCNKLSDPAIFASAHDYSSFVPQFPSGIYRSFDAGRSWSRTSIDLPGFVGGYASKLIVTPTGRLLATGSIGIACSEDMGQSWAPRCPPEK